MPNTTETSLLGYADDTNVFITNEESLIELEKLVSLFENATGAILNRNNKTKIFGTGKWGSREQWPITWLKVERQYFYTLGVYHSNRYALTIDKNWSNCVSAIRSHKQMLNNRKLTLFQRVTYANSCMLSKIWYITHIYPLTQNYAKEINKIIFLYIWNGSYEPIRRNTVYRPRQEGGLGVINCLVKSQVILLNSFLRCTTNDDCINPLLLHYCYIRMHNIISMDYSIHHASLSLTPYYELIYSLLKKILHVPGFPQVSKKNIYTHMLPKEKSYGEEHYPTFNWKQVWKNFVGTIFIPYEKEIIFKHLHLCLATNQRLAMVNRSTTSICNKCENNLEHTPLHIFYQCESIKPLFQWLLRVLLNVCNFKPISNIRFLYFDTRYENGYQKTVCNIFLYVYILTIWKTRKENLRIGILKKNIIKRISEYFDFIKLLPNTKLDKVFIEISRLDMDDLLNV